MLEYIVYLYILMLLLIGQLVAYLNLDPVKHILFDVGDLPIITTIPNNCYKVKSSSSEKIDSLDKKCTNTLINQALLQLRQLIINWEDSHL